MVGEQDREVGLFVHLCWEAARGEWHLDRELGQAAHAAITARARHLRCRVLAIGGSPPCVEAVFYLPASVPAAVLARQVMGAAGQALARLLRREYGVDVAGEAVWDGTYTCHSLSAGEAAEAAAALLRSETVPRRRSAPALRVREAAPAYRRGETPGPP